MNNININEKTVQFLERHKDLVNLMKMQDLYQLFLKENASYDTNQLTYIFLKAGFEPLKYMNRVPKGYALNLGL